MIRKVQVLGLAFLKIKVFTFLNDWFKNVNSVVFGVLLQRLNSNFIMRYWLLFLLFIPVLGLTVEPLCLSVQRLEEHVHWVDSESHIDKSSAIENNGCSKEWIREIMEKENPESEHAMPLILSSYEGSR